MRSGMQSVREVAIGGVDDLNQYRRSVFELMRMSSACDDDIDGRTVDDKALFSLAWGRSL